MGGVTEDDPDLAVLDQPSGPRVRPGLPGGLGALLQEPRSHEHQHPGPISGPRGKVLDHVVTHVITHGLSVQSA